MIPNDEAQCCNCHDQGWVCESHPNIPWDDGDASCCGGAGMPCKVCNDCDEDTAPRMPKGTKTTWSILTGWIN